MTNTPIITPSEMLGHMNFAFSEGNNIHFHGASGIGKTDIVRAGAKAQAAALGATFYEVGKDPVPADLENAYAFITFLTSVQDVLDVKGAPQIVNEKTTFQPNELLPDAKVHGRYGLFFLDELSQGQNSVTNGLTGILLGGQLGKYTFPKDWRIAACSNRRQDNANIQKLGAQVHQRFSNYEVNASVKDWAAYRISQGSNGTVPAFLRLCGDGPDGLLHTYTKGDICFASPRSWEKVDKLISDGVITDQKMRENIAASMVGVAAASTLEGFLAMASQLTTWQAIVADPANARLPEQGTKNAISALFALIGMMCQNVTRDTLANAICYLERMPKEFQQTFMLDLQTKSPDLMDTLEVSRWRANNNDFAV
tara:strand:+ start:353 stop:1456 length:1104 start_codon:yes stop_codon:yes gene_type:complete